MLLALHRLAAQPIEWVVSEADLSCGYVAFLEWCKAGVLS